MQMFPWAKAMHDVIVESGVHFDNMAANSEDGFATSHYNGQLMINGLTRAGYKSEVTGDEMEWVYVYADETKQTGISFYYEVDEDDNHLEIINWFNKNVR